MQSFLKDAVKKDDQKMIALFLKYPTLLDVDDERDCWQSVILMKDSKLAEFRKTKLKYELQPVPTLTTIDQNFLKLFCKSERNLADLKKELEAQEKLYQRFTQFRAVATNSAGISAAPGTYRSNTECRRDLLENNANLLFGRANTFVVHDQNCGGLPCYLDGIDSDRLLSAVKEKTPRGTRLVNPQLMLDIEKYCQSDSGQKSPFDDFDIQLIKQIIVTVS